MENKEMVNSNLVIAEQAIKNLKSVVEGNRSKRRGSNVIELETVNGVLGISFGLWKDEDVAVARTRLSDGAIMERHFHKEKETIIMVKGELRVYMNGESKKFRSGEESKPIILHVGDVLTIDPDVPHAALAVGEVIMIVATVPASEFFPDCNEQ